MRTLRAAELLNAWEHALGQAVEQRALILLGAAENQSLEWVAQLSIGQRDARLLTMRELTFGAAIAAVAHCPKCGEHTELSFNVSDIRLDSAVSSEPLTLTIEGYEIVFRLPNSMDMSIVSTLQDAETIRQKLLERCILSATREGRQVALREMSVLIIGAVTERMAQSDRQAEVELEITCPECGYEWQGQFDINSFFWSELNGWAKRILYEIHLLAGYYGWSEADILNMSALRRRLYLQMVGGS